MDSSLTSISKIFTEKLLRIPDYQRGYAWTTKEISEFWNDITYLEPNKNHYVGVLTLEDVPQKNIDQWIEDHWIICSKSYHPYYIVDGQQRITTIIILLQCIIEEIQKRGSDIRLNYTDMLDVRRKFIYEEKDSSSARSYIFGYDKDNPSYEYLKRKIFIEDSINSGTIENTIYTQNLSTAKNFFMEKLNAIEVKDIEIIYKKITQNLLFNIYSLDEEIDTYVAFETMNNRGKPLSHLELLKNRLIYLSTKVNEEEVHKITLRHSINECWKSMYHFLGKDMSRRLDDDVFLYHHSTIYFKDLTIIKDSPDIDEDKVIRLYDIPMFSDELHSFRYIDHRHYQVNNRSVLLDDIFSAKPIDDNTRTQTIDIPSITNYVKSLKKSVETWFSIHNPALSNYDRNIVEWLSRINKLPNNHTVKILLLEALNSDYDVDEMIDLLKNMERLLFINTLVRRLYHTQSTFIPLALELKRSKSIPSIAQKINHHVDKILKSTVTPFKETFKDGDYYKWEGIKYFLYQYEYLLKSQSRSERDKLSWDEFVACESDNDYSTVEHIYPQKATNTYWRTHFAGVPLKQRKQLRHTLGNLVPLSRGKNASVSNKSFLDKKKDYQKGCYSEIELLKYENWSKVEIQERTAELLYFLDSNWQLGLCPPSIIKDKQKRKTHYLDFANINF